MLKYPRAPQLTNITTLHIMLFRHKFDILMHWHTAIEEQNGGNDDDVIRDNKNECMEIADEKARDDKQVVESIDPSPKADEKGETCENGRTSLRYPRRRAASTSTSTSHENVSQRPLVAISPIDGKKLKVNVRLNDIKIGSEIGRPVGSSPRLGGRQDRGRGGRGRE